MSLSLIVGPMKSNKSLALISYFSPLQYSQHSFGLFQPITNVRESSITSRAGANIPTRKITSLTELLVKPPEYIGIDEIHFFPAAEISAIKQLLDQNKTLVVAGLDMDHRGKLFGTFEALLALGPDSVEYRRAVCEVCKNYTAVYSQALQNGQPVSETVPALIPEDGTYTYEPRCPTCFIRV